MSKSAGRGDSTAKAIKKDKTPGPATYSTEKSITRIAGYKNVVNAVGVSGFAVGGGCNVSTGDKMRLKTNRFLDEVTKRSKKVPGVGQYLNVEKGMNMKSRPITSLRQKRH